MPHREYTVQELVEQLSKYPMGCKVKLLDADTDWIISKFTVSHDLNVVCFYPCDYADMDR